MRPVRGDEFNFELGKTAASRRYRPLFKFAHKGLNAAVPEPV